MLTKLFDTMYNILMLTVNIRDLSRTPKRVVEEVKKTKQPKQIVSQKKPQAVIVSLEDYQKLEDLKHKQSVQGLFKLAELAEKLQVKGPADLSEKMDEYLWDNYDK